MSDKTTLFELKEKAKWSHNNAEKKAAISELSEYGYDALPGLEEILNITAYEDIRTACIDAIKSIQGNLNDASKRDNLETSTIEKTRDQKKEEDKSGRKELKLADLPP